MTTADENLSAGAVAILLKPSASLLRTALTSCATLISCFYAKVYSSYPIFDRKMGKMSKLLC